MNHVSFDTSGLAAKPGQTGHSGQSGLVWPWKRGTFLWKVHFSLKSALFPLKSALFLLKVHFSGNLAKRRDFPLVFRVNPPQAAGFEGFSLFFSEIRPFGPDSSLKSRWFRRFAPKSSEKCTFCSKKCTFVHFLAQKCQKWQKDTWFIRARRALWPEITGGPTGHRWPNRPPVPCNHVSFSGFSKKVHESALF